MTGSLLVVGSVAFDTVETRAGRRQEILGGSATYISLAASHLCPVNLVGVVGRDDFPQEHVDLLGGRGIDTAGLERASGRTFRWSGVYAADFSSRQTLDTQLGVFADFSPKLPQSYLASRTVMLGNIHPALQHRVLRETGAGAYTAVDTMNLWIETTRSALEAVIGEVDLLLVNDEEALQLTGELQVRRAAQAILEQGPKAVVIKRGEHGAFLFTSSTIFFVPAIPLPEVTDPTGAGDTFAGGLLGYLARSGDYSDRSLKRGMIYGAALASATVQGFGVERLVDLDGPALEQRCEELVRLVEVPER